METSPEFNQFYALNSHFPDAVPPPIVMKRSTTSGNLQDLFVAGRQISYASPKDARMRGAVPLPGKEVAKYNIMPPLPSDEELYKRGLQAWQYSDDWSPQQNNALAKSMNTERQIAKDGGCGCDKK